VERIELPLAVLETAALPLYYTGIHLAPQAGIEPTTNWLTANCTTSVLLWNKLAPRRGVEPLCSARQAGIIDRYMNEAKLGGDGWSRTSSAEAADLQSTGVTNFPTSPLTHS
jgi:hypothetical protein